MEALDISPDFTIEDIHRIRERNYELTKDMTTAEKAAYYNNSGREAEREIERRRVLKRKAAASANAGITMHLYADVTEEEKLKEAGK